MRDYEKIYNNYLAAFAPLEEKIPSPPYRCTDEELGAVIKDLNFYEAVGYMLKHLQYGGSREFHNYAKEKYSKYNWWWNNASKYMGKNRNKKYQQLRDATYAVIACRPDLKPTCDKLIHSIEKDIAIDVCAKYPELNTLFPEDKLFQIPEIEEDDYTAGYRAGWNEFAKALTSAQNSEVEKNHKIYTMHEIAMEWRYGIYGSIQMGWDDYNKEYEIYQDAVAEGRENDCTFGGVRIWDRPVPAPDPLPVMMTYEEVLFEQIKDSKLHDSFYELIQNIKKPELPASKESSRKLTENRQIPKTER